MSYCLNPACTNPENLPQDEICSSCGETLALNNRYRATRILGRGGFATTFLAVDQTLPGTPTCVIKQLRPVISKPEMGERARKLFQQEAATLGSIGHHPQLPRLLDYFELDQEFYLVQEYVRGSTLKQEVERLGPLSEPMVEALLRELLPILDYVHSQGMIHQDIKPANIIRRSIDNKLVLIDFGAVKAQVNQAASTDSQAKEDITVTSFAVGTTGYAPPEQFAMRPVYASDIYSLGITCLYLFTGKSPKAWAYDQATGVLNWHNQVDISPYLKDILDNMLAVSTQDRYQSAKEVLAALEPQDQTSDLSQSLPIPATTTLYASGSGPYVSNVDSYPETEHFPGLISKIKPVVDPPFIGALSRAAGQPLSQPQTITQTSDHYASLGPQQSVENFARWQVWLGGGCISAAMMLIGFGLSQVMDNGQLAQKPDNPAPTVENQPFSPNAAEPQSAKEQSRNKLSTSQTSIQQNKELTRLEVQGKPVFNPNSSHPK